MNAQRFANAIGERLFARETYHSEKANAQRNLSGRTHYFDDDTLSFFEARVIRTAACAEGLVFVAQESVDHPSLGRVHRVVVHNLLGNVVERGEFSDESLFGDARKGRKMFDAACEKYNAQGMTESMARAILEQKRAQAERETRRLADAELILNA